MVHESTEEDVPVKHEDEVEDRSSQVSHGGRDGGRAGGGFSSSSSASSTSSSRLSEDLMLDLEVLLEPGDDRCHDQRPDPVRDFSCDSPLLPMSLRLWAPLRPSL